MAEQHDSAIHAELERVRSAYDTPVLSLLNSRTSDFQIAAMRAVFETSQAIIGKGMSAPTAFRSVRRAR